MSFEYEYLPPVPKAAQLPKLLTRDEVAAALRVTVITVDRMIARGDLPALRISGKNTRIREDDLVAFLNSRIVTNNPQEDENR